MFSMKIKGCSQHTGGCSTYGSIPTYTDSPEKQRLIEDKANRPKIQKTTTTTAHKQLILPFKANSGSCPTYSANYVTKYTHIAPQNM